MNLQSWFCQAYSIRFGDGYNRIVILKYNQLKFSTPCSHNARLNRSFSVSQQKRGLLETHYYCLLYPIPNDGLATTRAYAVDPVEVERVNASRNAYANPQVFEWLMGFPIDWTVV